MAVGMVVLSGMWSEVMPTQEVREVLGKVELKAVLIRARSRRARVGRSRLLL
jgi:hypothetical protein